MSHRHLVLGLLSEQPMTGYEIKKQVGKSLQSVTNASYGTLYPTLHRLLAEGAVHVKEYPQERRPARKVYRLTERGRQELDDWLRKPAGADHVRREFLLKLFLARDLPPDDLRALIKQRQTETEARLEELRQTQATANGEAPINLMWVREYTAEMCEAELQWLSKIMAQLETKMNSSAD